MWPLSLNCKEERLWGAGGCPSGDAGAYRAKGFSVFWGFKFSDTTRYSCILVTCVACFARKSSMQYLFLYVE